MQTFTDEEIDPDLLIDERSPTVEELVDQRLLQEAVHQALSTLTERERVVLMLRYGMSGVTYALTLEEAGRTLKYSRQRVRGIEYMALAKLQHRNRKSLLEGFAKSDWLED